jgi:hypothetical protein
VKMTTYLQLQLKLRMSGSMLPTLNFAFMASTGISLPNMLAKDLILLI